MFVFGVRLAAPLFVTKALIQITNAKLSHCVTIVTNKSAFQNPLSVLKQFAPIRPISSATADAIPNSISSLQIKKRPVRKKKPLEEEELKPPGVYDVVAYSTADEYNIEELVKGLRKQELYEPKHIESNKDVVHAVAKYQVGAEPREIFFFREGSVVMWNIADLESSNLLTFLKQYEQDRYSETVVHGEAENMTYKHLTNSKPSLSADGEILISSEHNVLEKYTFSNAMALSVKLGIWEASLNHYIDTIEFVTEDLKRGKRLKMSQEDVLRKHGELFALRHLINLSSDLLDTPDFYWDREQLEALYLQTCSYFSISRRTRVMNEKINHCVELIELLSSHLSDKHHVRLEWMIIVLIMIEVVFEIVHYLDRIIQ